MSRRSTERQVFFFGVHRRAATGPYPRGTDLSAGLSFFDNRIPFVGIDGIYGPETEEAVAAYQRAGDCG